MKLMIAAAMACSLATGAAASATPCKEAGSASAKQVLYYTADEGMLDGLGVALNLGLEPSTFPYDDIVKHPNACVQMSFTADGRTWTIYGSDDDTPTRWARAEGTSMIAFLADMPPPDQAHAWAEAQRAHRTDGKTVTFKSMVLAVVIAEGDKRRVFGFFDAIPDNARLAQVMRSAIAGRTPAVLGFDVSTGVADELRMIEPLTLQVIASKGAVIPVDKTEPDGLAFETKPDGAAKARLSGFVCPKAVGALRRSAVFTSGSTDGSQEAGCRYVSERARLAIVATHAVPGESMRDAMAQMIEAPMAASVGHPASMPKPPTIPARTGAASSFSTPDGARQSVWAFARGDWFVEIYALYGPDDEAEVSAALSSLSVANRAP